MRHILAKHHQAISKTYRQHSDSMDDGAEHKSLFTRLAGHHHELAKALLEPSSLGDLPDVGNETRTGDAGYGIHPVPEIKKRQEDYDAEISKMFGDI